jgi:3-hydroxyacyl-CoA dehydrogenase/enoyl-CoA hydratase/3-hydroxybutyryl-CoA epimerase
MASTHFTHDIDGDGIAVVTWNSPGRTMNVIDAAVTSELSALIEELATDGAVKGAIITSGKDTFCAGADLTVLESFSRTFAETMSSEGEEAANTKLFDESRKWSLLCRRLETCGKPWVAAINGTALGGGFELTLACHPSGCRA